MKLSEQSVTQLLDRWKREPWDGPEVESEIVEVLANDHPGLAATFILEAVIWLGTPDRQRFLELPDLQRLVKKLFDQRTALLNDAASCVDDFR